MNGPARFRQLQTHEPFGQHGFQAQVQLVELPQHFILPRFQLVERLRIRQRFRHSNDTLLRKRRLGRETEMGRIFPNQEKRSAKRETRHHL